MKKRRFSILAGKRSFRRDNGGATVVEFALVIVPFIACMFAIIELGLMFFASQVLEASVADATRLILTGQAQNANYDSAGFKNQICTPGVKALFKCDGIKIDVRTSESFGAGNLGAPINAQTKLLDTSNFTYDPGTQCKIVIVRVVYEWPTFVRNFGLDLATLADGKHLIMATAAFRNEPYSGSGFCS